jgi:hypothetical protein
VTSRRVASLNLTGLCVPEGRRQTPQYLPVFSVGREPHYIHMNSSYAMFVVYCKERQGWESSIFYIYSKLLNFKQFI